MVIGLSGGIDSAVTAAIAVDALGAEKVRCVMLPYRFTSKASLADAAACAQALGAGYEIVPIAAPVEGFDLALAELFAGRSRDVTEENLQARTRGVMLMAISNKFNELLVTTGNKSEVSVGYATLYGDMNGASIRSRICSRPKSTASLAGETEAGPAVCWGRPER